jgi:protein phosphatase 2C family protein 2/3
MDKDLLSHPTLARIASSAGTTSNVLYFHGKQLWVASSGDSRAVLCRRKGSAMEAVDLSHDHKPDLPNERKRIEKAGGTVSAAGPRGLPPSRVFVNGRVGLAMSRSIGDGETKGFGVIPDPEIVEVTLTPPVDGKGDGDLFVIVASDGIWEFISSQLACEMVLKQSDDATAASESLIQLATKRWQEEEGTYRDDITCIVAFLPFLDEVRPRAPTLPPHVCPRAPRSGAATPPLSPHPSPLPSTH